MKYTKYIQYVLLAIGAITVLTLLLTGNDDPGVAAANEAISVSVMLTWAYIVLGIAAAVTILMPLINLAQNPKGAVRSLIGLGALVVVLGICFALSSAEPVPNSAGGFFTNTAELKLSDTGLYTSYGALAVTVVLVIFGEIRNSFK